MINENILSSIKSHKERDPSYVVMIEDIQQKRECNQDSLVFLLHQIDLNKMKMMLNDRVTLQDDEESINDFIDKIFSGAKLTSRNFHVMSDLSSDEDGLSYAQLIGYLSDERRRNVSDYYYDTTNELTLTHNIEILETKLNKIIEIEFNQSYKNKPKIIVNIDEEYESLYRSISMDFDSWKSGNDYEGVTLTFNSLKMKNSYPSVSIIIIGDLRTEEE